VDTDNTTTKILDALNREKNGRVTFMPLNRLRTKPLNYPESNDKIMPMMEVLEFDKAYTKAVEQVVYSVIIEIIILMLSTYTLFNFLRIGIWSVSNLC